MEELLPIFPVFVTVHRRLESIEPSMQIAYPKSSTIILTPGVVYNRKKKKKNRKESMKESHTDISGSAQNFPQV